MVALWLASLSAVAGCGRPFDVRTAPGFVALENQHDFDWRATTPEGVWTQAMTLQLRDVSGYALLESADTTSADGTKGKLLRFGHDEDDKPYVYGVAIFAAQGRLFVVEAGGRNELFAHARACELSSGR